MFLTRSPRPSLRPFVRTLWATSHPTPPASIPATRERVLPTGDMHLVFRLSDHPLRLLDDVDGASGHTIGHAVVGGARASFYVREVANPAWSVGAQLGPGAAELLFGMPAGKLADRHIPLDDLWGRSAERVREQLFEARHPERQLDLLESLLAARLPTVRGLHPAVAQALAQFRTAPDVRAAVDATGYSHRRFTALFREGVGMTPKRFCRVLRFQRVLGRVAEDPTAAWADLALDAGYSDQSHFNREFREFAGITPGEYRSVAPRHSHHVPLPGSISFKTAGLAGATDGP